MPITVLENIISLIIAYGILSISFGIGLKALSLLHVELKSNLQFIITSIGLGLIVISHIVLLLGFWKLYYPAVAWFIFISIFIIFYKTHLVFISRSLLLFKNSFHFIAKETVFTKILFLALLIFIILSSLGAFTPPFAADVLRHHVVVTRLFAAHHRIIFTPIIFFNAPLGIEMLYLLGILLYNNAVGLLLNSILGTLAAFAVFHIGKIYADKKIGLLSSLLFYSTSIVWYSGIYGKVDSGLFFYTALGFLYLYEWTQKKDMRLLIVSGIFVGFCASLKYTGLYTTVLSFLVLVVLLILRQNSSLKNKFLQISFFILPAFITGSPWYIKNWIMTGNPIWPFFYNLLGGRGWNIAAHQSISGEVRGMYSRLGHNLLGFLTGPIQLNLKMPDFFERAGIGPLFLGILPFSLLIREIRQRYKLIFIFSFLFYAFWFPFAQEGRFLIPVVMLLGIPVAHTIFILAQRSKPVKITILGSLSFWIFINDAALVERTINFFPASWGLESKNRFLERTIWFYKDIEWMNKNLPKDAVVLSDHTMLYYLNRDFVWGTFTHQGLIDYARIKDVEEYRHILKNLGVTYIFMGEIEISEEDPLEIRHYKQLRQEFIKKYCRLIYFNPEGVTVKSLVRNDIEKVKVFVYEITNPTP